MIDITTVLTLAIALLASAVMAWVIGAGSSGATPFAPAVGANAISVLRAALLVGVLGLLRGLRSRDARAGMGYLLALLKAQGRRLRR